MSAHDVRMIILSTDDLVESIRFYSETLGMPLKFRDGAHFAALDGGSLTLALHASGAKVLAVEKDRSLVPVLHDLLGLSLGGRTPKFVKNFMAEQNDIPAAIGAYVKAVKDVSFPAAEHGFSA